jgi:hypothetical protein
MVSGPVFMFYTPDSFSVVSRASGLVFMFCAPKLVFGGNEFVGSLFHILRFRLDFGVTEGVGSRCHVLRARTHFWLTEGVGSRFLVLWSRTRFRWCRLGRVPFSCFARSDSFSAVPRASGPGLIFGSTECVESHFHIFLSRTCFRRYQGCQDPFSCFALSDSFSSVPRASGPVFMFCAPGLVFSGAECVGSRFHVLHARTRFRRCRGCWDPFSYFALPDSF